MDVEGLQWITGDLTGGIVKGTDSRSQRNFVYEIKSAKSNIQAHVHKNDISFHVKISSVGRLWAKPCEFNTPICGNK
ncbi:hypothetical protein D3C76_1489320 [compost metagenome]